MYLRSSSFINLCESVGLGHYDPNRFKDLSIGRFKACVHAAFATS